jgi:predicted amidohydrolase
MKIGYVQFAPRLCDLDGTLESLAALLPQCKADLVVLPELCNSGYNFPSAAEAAATAETVSDSRFLSFLTEHCRRHGCHVVSGFNERDGEALYNTAVLVGPQGCRGRYRKLHLFKHEKDFFQPGNLGLPVFDCGPARVGMLICFDWLFPEAWRVLALQGADVICHPCNLVLPGLAQRAVPVHALMNRLYIVTANRVGTERKLAFTGASLIADPAGEVLVKAPEREPQVAMVEIDLARARDKWITPLNHLLRDRRPDQYQSLTETVDGPSVAANEAHP